MGDFVLFMHLIAPWYVQPPEAEEKGPSHILVAWQPPSHVNGELAGFSLRKAGVTVYSGILLSYNVTNLTVCGGV